MSLATALQKPPVIASAGRSRMDYWYDMLTPDEQTIVTAAVTDPTWRHSDLREMLINNSPEHAPFPSIGVSSFALWRKARGLKR